MNRGSLGCNLHTGIQSFAKKFSHSLISYLNFIDFSIESQISRNTETNNLKCDGLIKLSYLVQASERLTDPPLASRGCAPSVNFKIGVVQHQCFFLHASLKKLKGDILFLGRQGVSHPPRKQPKTARGPVGIFPEEKNPVGSAVTEILSFRRTDEQTSFYFVLQTRFIVKKNYLGLAITEIFRYRQKTSVLYIIGYTKFNGHN